MVAKAKGFDPLIADNWYSLTIHDYMTFKVFSFSSLPSFSHLLILFVQKEKAGGVLRYYGSSPRKALMDVYPNIGLNEKKFRTNKMRYRM